MESTYYININTNNLNATERISVVDFDIFYEEKLFDYKLVSPCVREIKKWHEKKYKTTCPHILDLLDDKTIIKYENKYVSFTYNIIKKPFTFRSKNLLYTEEGYNVRATIKQINSIENLENSSDYEKLIELTQKIVEEIFIENKSLNNEYDEEQQKLCAIEYARDHC